MTDFSVCNIFEQFRNLLKKSTIYVTDSRKTEFGVPKRMVSAPIGRGGTPQELICQSRKTKNF
jgi:hypothetical protein